LKKLVLLRLGKSEQFPKVEELPKMRRETL
jgi:hypothetical protein